MVRVKICGIADTDAALVAAEAGADAIGFIFAPSRRRVTIERAKAIAAALGPFVTKVGVFVDEEHRRIEDIVGAVTLDMVQLHGRETPEFCDGFPVPVMKAIRVSDSTSLAAVGRYRAAAILLDSYDPETAGGTGRTFDWDLAAQAAHSARVVLSGGLTPENVIEAIERVRPYGVDVSSGVETDGKKDHAKIREFVRRVREWDVRRAGAPAH